MPAKGELTIPTLGSCVHRSPLVQRHRLGFISDSDRVLSQVKMAGDDSSSDPPSFEAAGPRERLFFDPSTVTAAIVTCGGLSPGLNNVIRSCFHELHHGYGVPRVLGIRDGYRGLSLNAPKEPVELTPTFVQHIHDAGGTVLGSSRGRQEPSVAVDFMEQRGVRMLFCVGGDGTQRGASSICDEIARRGLGIAVVGIPKTIDNDVPHVKPSFGYATALSIASDAIRAAHVEATGAPNGVALVKVMGRDAGFIAAGTAIVSQEANFVLVPEIAFPLEGFLDALGARVRQRGHAVVIVAEGAGQHIFESETDEYDPSGNPRYRDIGVFLRDEIGRWFDERGDELNLKYIEPSYLIRSVPAQTWDRYLCDLLARNAVHAAMAGKTQLVIGQNRGAAYHVPIREVVRRVERLDLNGELWSSVMATTGQPGWVK